MKPLLHTTQVTSRTFPMGDSGQKTQDHYRLGTLGRMDSLRRGLGFAYSLLDYPSAAPEAVVSAALSVATSDRCYISLCLLS